MTKIIAIQGITHSFHHLAALQFFGGDDFALLPQDTFAGVFSAVESGAAEYGVAAVENSLYGSIDQVYDLLLGSGLWVAGEVYEHISQCLIGLPGATVADIREVHSHPVALAQCSVYLDKRLPHAARIEHHDTAASVEDVKKWGDSTKTAIAGAQAAEAFGMQLLARGIETDKQNYTRFFVLQPHKQLSGRENKTSLILHTTADSQPGALYRALGVFHERAINLTMLHSRPIIGQAWRYHFYIDLEAGLESPEFASALAALGELGYEVTILGSYVAGDKRLQG